MPTATDFQKQTLSLTAHSYGYYDPVFGSVPSKTCRRRTTIVPGQICYLLGRGFLGKCTVFEVRVTGVYFDGREWMWRVAGDRRSEASFISMDHLNETLFTSVRDARAEAEKNNRLRKVKVKSL